MNTDNHSEQDHTTPEDAFKRIQDDARAVMQPLTAAMRKQANGHEVDITDAVRQARARFTDFVQQVSASPGHNGIETFTPDDLMNAYWTSIKDRKDSASTGIASLNAALSGGFEADRLMVLLGAPGSGKTTLTNQMVNHAADAGRPVLYVTSEDRPLTLLAKTIARRGQIDYTAVQKGYPSEKERINAAFADYREQKSARFLRYLDASGGTTLNTIYEQAEAHFQRHKSEASGAGIIVVDYLQRLARGELLGADIRQSITVYTERLREIACDLHCTVIALCAMNRASGYHANNSTIASAKESGDIDYGCDVLMAIGPQENTDEPAPGLRRWIIRIDKNRQGSATFDGSHILLDWYASRQQFTEVRREDSQSVNAEAFSSRANGNSGRRGRR